MLNAGATIGAVRETDTHGHYLVRSELHTFLSDVIKRELKRKPEETERGLDLDRLEKRIREALMPHVLDTSDAVLQHLHPIDEMRGFTSEIFLNEVDPQHLRPVRNLLTAGSSLRVVPRDKNDDTGYFVHADLYTTLARIRARELAMAAHAGRTPIEGGALAACRHRRQPRRAPADQRPRRPGRRGPQADEDAARVLRGIADAGARADLGRVAQGRGAGDRRPGGERRHRAEAPGPHASRAQRAIEAGREREQPRAGAGAAARLPRTMPTTRARSLSWTRRPTRSASCCRR